MPSARARLATDRPARYGKQLCDHLGRKLETEWDGVRGVIPLPGGKARCELDASGEGLVLTAWGRDAESLAAVQDVTGRHLERFGARDDLTVQWEAVAGEPVVGEPVAGEAAPTENGGRRGAAGYGRTSPQTAPRGGSARSARSARLVGQLAG